MTTKPTTRELVADRREQYAFHDDIVYLRETGRGLSRETVEEISKIKDEPDWMLQLRLRAFEHFQKRLLDERRRRRADAAVRGGSSLHTGIRR